MIGQMTDSWGPSSLVVQSISSSFPHVHAHLELPLFRDYHQDGERATVLRTQEAWDRKFRSWCARAERRWLEEHPTHVEFDGFTGMPKNPKPAVPQLRSREWWQHYHTLDPTIPAQERMKITDRHQEEA